MLQIHSILDQSEIDEKKKTDLSPNIQSKNLQDELFQERIKEQKQRRYFRWIMFAAFFLLLLAQYIALCIFIKVAIEQDFLTKIETLLAIIIPATLGETYAIIHIMVKFIFSPGDFKPSPNKTSD